MWDKLSKMSEHLPAHSSQPLLEDICFQITREKHKNLPTDDIKNKALYQFSRILDLESIPDPTDTLQKGQVVHANLIGIGKVLNDFHFCIVWDFDPTSGHIVVIPMTSNKSSRISSPETPYVPGFDQTNQFNIGVVDGANSSSRGPIESIVKINQAQTISRRAVHIIKNRTPPGDQCRYR